MLALKLERLGQFINYSDINTQSKILYMPRIILAERRLRKKTSDSSYGVELIFFARILTDCLAWVFIQLPHTNADLYRIQG